MPELAVTLFENPNFGGRNISLASGHYRFHTPADFNDVASSIKVPDGLVAFVYENADDGGGYGVSVDLMEDWPDLSKINFSKKISFVSVFSAVKSGFIWARNSMQGGNFVAGHWERPRAGSPAAPNHVAVVSPPIPAHPPGTPPIQLGQLPDEGVVVRDHTHGPTTSSDIAAPQNILQIQYEAPASAPADWAKSNGKTFPDGSAFEWVQVTAPNDEYDQFSLVGAAGWVINIDESQGDVPFDHPFGFDWEFSLAVDNDPKYTALLSPANVNDPVAAAQQLGLTVPPNGLLGVEWDKGLLPASFRNNVTHGDRAAIFGRWISDRGHDTFTKTKGIYRAEIHPPLLVATANVHKDTDGSQFSRAVFISRPFLGGQTYCLDPKNAYKDGSDDDGPFFHHLLNEFRKVVGDIPVLSELGIGQSWKVEAHPKIKSFPFKGAHLFHVMVRPPAPPPPATHAGVSPLNTPELHVSFHFAVRSGCAVQVTSSAAGTIDVFISMNSAGYVPPPLPKRDSRTFSRDELDKLSKGSGLKILELEAIVTGLGLLTSGPIDAAKIIAVLSRGIETDAYVPLAEVNVLDRGNAVINAPGNNIPAGKGITTGDGQPYPVYGWVEARWATPTLVSHG